MKKAYETPVLTAEEFDLVDVIAASEPDEPQNPPAYEPELTTKNSTFEGPEIDLNI